jgi:hypothetical protein
MGGQRAFFSTAESDGETPAGARHFIAISPFRRARLEF